MLNNVLMPLLQILSQIMRADKMNSDFKIRSHQRLITPPEGGSFRQLTSTMSNKEKCIHLMRADKMWKENTIQHINTDRENKTRKR